MKKQNYKRPRLFVIKPVQDSPLMAASGETPVSNVTMSLGFTNEGMSTIALN